MEVPAGTISCRPLTLDYWEDLELLFGPRGACGGCWCMWWRLPHREYEAGKGEKHRQSFQARVAAGPPPGVLAYDGNRPVGWCSIAPRAEFLRLRTSRLFKPLDDEPVWSITCLYLAAECRGTGLAEILVSGALDFAASRGAQAVEAYAVAPPKETAPVFLSCGPYSLFKKLGFESIRQPSPTRHLMRKRTGKSKRHSSR